MRARQVCRSVAIEDSAELRPPSRHDRLVIVASVVATVAAIAVPAVTAGTDEPARTVVGPGPDLTAAAHRVLKQAPGAFETAGNVILPAFADPDRVWTGALGPGRIMGPTVPLAVHGLAEPGYLPPAGTRPAWLVGVGTKDHVYDDVGALSFACTRWPGVHGCTGTLLMEHAGQRYIFRSGLHLAQRPDGVSSFPVLAGSQPTNLVLGGAPPDTARVVVTRAHGRPLRGHVAASSRSERATSVWWVTVNEPVSDVTMFDRDGNVLARPSLGG
ncbi:MAG: hypothetical protein ACM3XQ_02330 [Nocardioidaceae bacterium]